MDPMENRRIFRLSGDDPLLFLIEWICDRAAQIGKSRLDSLKFPDDLFRVEVDSSTALSTGEIVMRFYPSDALLCYAAALRAIPVNLEAVEQIR